MKNIERNRRWKIREKMVRLFKSIRSLRTKAERKAQHFYYDEKPGYFNRPQYLNSPQTLAMIR